VQKQLLALALEQSAAAVSALENFDLNSGTAKEDINAAFQASLDRSLAAQSVVTEYAAKQTKAAIEATKQQPGIAGTPAETLADSMQRSFDTVLGVQKEMLSIAVKPLKAVRA
jgi:Flp pilus assembly protein TadG